MKKEIEEILFHTYGRIDQMAVSNLLDLFNANIIVYQEKLLKKADDMKESGKIWHSNKFYTDGIDCALDNMKIHIKAIGEEIKPPEK